jgi:MinD-like ATPase involved in chromosome partitioning or flagellar assembly
MNCIFLSYKGGTGRTTLLANVAYQLSKLDKRVVLLDFDFDAPGLDLFKLYEPPKGKDQMGLLDFLNYSLDKKGNLTEIKISDYLYEVETLEKYDGPIWIMWAGGMKDIGYFRQQVMDQRNYLRGQKITKDLTKLLHAGKDKNGKDIAPDYILFDSRPGYSYNVGVEASAFDTNTDAVILVTNLNNKITEKTIDSVISFREDLIKHEIKLLAAFSQVKTSDSSKKEVVQILEKAKELLSKLHFSCPALEIPFCDRMLYDYLVIEEENELFPDKDLILRAYKDVAMALIKLNENDIINKIDAIDKSNRKEMITGFETLQGNPIYRADPRLYNDFARELGKFAKDIEDYQKIVKQLETAIYLIKQKDRLVRPEIYTWISKTYRKMAEMTDASKEKKKYLASAKKYIAKQGNQSTGSSGDSIE